MGRRPTGTIIEPKPPRQQSFALRVRAGGQRYFLTLGLPEDGWTYEMAQRRNREIVAAIRAGTWIPPKRQPRTSEIRPHENRTAEAYGLLRKAAQIIDQRYRQAERTVRPDLGEALDAIYAAEDAIQRAVRLGE